MVGSLDPTKVITDSILFLRDNLNTNIVDPISGARISNSKFVLTNYPQRKTDYPLITVKEDGMSDVQRMGMQSETTWAEIPVEVRVWARNVVERDKLSQQVYTFLKNNQFGTGSETVNFGMYGFKLNSTVDIDDINENGVSTNIKSKQMKYKWNVIL